MTNLYFCLIDTTKANESLDSRWYTSAPECNNLTRYILDFAKHNNSKPGDIIFRVFSKKSDWSEQSRLWLDLVKLTDNDINNPKF